MLGPATTPERTTSSRLKNTVESRSDPHGSRFGSLVDGRLAWQDANRDRSEPVGRDVR